MAAVATGHAHLHAGTPTRRSVRLVLTLALAPFLVATLVGLAVLWPRHGVRNVHPLGTPAPLVNATVTAANGRRCGPGGLSRCQDVVIRVTSGPDRGQRETMPEQVMGPGVPDLHPGDLIVVGRNADPLGGPVQYNFADYQRSFPLALLGLAFAAVVVLVARWRGLAALAGLGLAWFFLVRFVLPNLLDGRSPVAVALVASAAIMIPVLYLAHGLNARTTTALLGTLTSLALTGLLAAAFVAATHLTGTASDEATYIASLAGNVNWSGLMLAGVVIGSLGVLNDVTVTQASATWELHEANPERPPGRLYRASMRIGRDHIASSVYTLVLAYAGASLPLLILFALAGQPIHSVLTGETVAEELVRTLVGSIGLVASVPITTALAALIVTRADDGINDAAPRRLRATGVWTSLHAVARRRAPTTARRAPLPDPAPRRAPAASPPWRPPKAEREFWVDP
jgi:uncharacterized membrane protein